MDDRKISICIPTYNRSDMTIESFYDVYEDERVSEIVIVDDASGIEIYNDLKRMCDALTKVKLYRNEENIDCFLNKKKAIELSTNDQCILLDSDNRIDKSYIDELYKLDIWYKNIIYTPSFAKPNFDFREYQDYEFIYKKSNIASYIDKPLFETCLNASNFFINKECFFKAWKGDIDPVTSDSIYFMLTWFERGYGLVILPNLHYEHKVWEGSHYKNNVHRTPPNLHNEILNKLRNLK